MGIDHLPDDHYLIDLLPTKISYNVGEVKTELRARCPAFQSLKSGDAQKVARRLCRTLQDRGEIWYSDTKPRDQADHLLRHPDIGVLQRPEAFFKGLRKDLAIAAHAFQHPIPFLGFEILRHNRWSIERIPDHEKLLGSEMFYKNEHQLPGFDILGAPNYEKSSSDRVIDISRQMSWVIQVAPDQRSHRQIRLANLRNCFAIVCQSLNCHPAVQRVLPVQLADESLNFLAALIFSGEKQFLLPVRLWPVGGHPLNQLTPIKDFGGWNNKLGTRPEIANSAVFQTFRNYPILSVTDVMHVSGHRRYAHAWAYQDELADADGCHLYFPPSDRLCTTPQAVIDLVLDTCWPIHVRPCNPFDAIPLQTMRARGAPIGLELISDAWLASLDISLSDLAVSQTELFPGEDIPATIPALRSVFCEKSIPVDGHLSCQLHKMCHLPPHHGSLYCKYHSIALMQVYLRSGEAYDGKLSLQRIRSSTYSEQYDRLLSLRAESAWIIDVEYWSLAGDKSPIPWSLSIRTLSGALVINTTIDYGMTLQTLIDLVAPHTRRDGQMPQEGALRSLYSVAKRHYQRDHTHGLTIEQVRTKLRGYQTVMSWCTSLDLQVFKRILAGGNQPIAPRCHAKQEIDIFRIVKAALGKDFPSMALGDVHRCLVPNKLRRFHNADEDVLAVLDILELLFELERD